MIQYNIATALCYHGRQYVNQCVSVGDECTIIDRTLVVTKPKTVFSAQPIVIENNPLLNKHYSKVLNRHQSQVYFPVGFSVLVKKEEKEINKIAFGSNAITIVETSIDKIDLSKVKEYLKPYISFVKKFTHKDDYIYSADTNRSNFLGDISDVLVIDNSTEFILNTKPQLQVASVNVISNKGKIEINTELAGYDDLSYTIQKDTFIEFNFSETIINVNNLPDNFKYFGKTLKGSFQRSGEYNFDIIYKDGEQNIKVTVPYYERLL